MSFWRPRHLHGLVKPSHWTLDWHWGYSLLLPDARSLTSLRPQLTQSTPTRMTFSRSNTDVSTPVKLLSCARKQGHHGAFLHKAAKLVRFGWRPQKTAGKAGIFSHLNLAPLNSLEKHVLPGSGLGKTLPRGGRKNQEVGRGAESGPDFPPTRGSTLHPSLAL